MESEVGHQASGITKHFTLFATKLVQSVADQLAQPSVNAG